MFEAVLRYFYALDYEVKSETDELAFHAKVYAAAEYFGLSILKNNAAMKFEKILDERVNIPGGISFSAAENVYQGTQDTDRVLRDLLVRAVYDSPNAFGASFDSEPEKLQVLFEDIPQFAVDHVRLHGGKLVIPPRLSIPSSADSKCRHCGHFFLLSDQYLLSYTDYFKCPNKSCCVSLTKSMARETYNFEKQRRLDMK